MKNKRLKVIYRKLYKSFGKQHWWPARTKLEVIIGAVLTQNTSWSNVERAIINLQKDNLLSFKNLCRVKKKKLALAIKPAGYFNIKAKRLKNVLEFFKNYYKGKLVNVDRVSTTILRQQLLGINGVGPETADSIILYAFNRPVFVVDAYTKRIFNRLDIISQDASYEEIQELFMKSLARQTKLFNEYHALIVKLGKDFCQKKKPRCSECPLLSEQCIIMN